MSIRIVRCSTPNYSPGRMGHSPRGIVIHTTVGSFSSAIEWFANPNSGVSAHYLVALDGLVAQLVDEEDTARHAGRISGPTTSLVKTGIDPNLDTIGIEFVDNGNPHGIHRPDEQYGAGAELIRRIALRWRIPLDRAHVVGHREIFDRKTCPGNVDVERLIREALEAM
jgi:N-acetylmuramoyl-L-alanine amidase